MSVRIGASGNLFLSSLQQYTMLHDMVAAHSIIRVSISRANHGRMGRAV